MKVQVDFDLCESNALCETETPFAAPQTPFLVARIAETPAVDGPEAPRGQHWFVDGAETSFAGRQGQPRATPRR